MSSLFAYKEHIFTLKINIKSLQANCQRATCKVHIYVKIQNQERKLKQVGEMKKNIAVFSSDAEIVWENISIKYDEASGTYLDNNITVSIHYQTSEQGSRMNKLKIGQVTVNLAKLLNTKTYRINNQYPIQKCYDPNAKIKMGIDLIQNEQTYGSGFKYDRTKQQIFHGNRNQGDIYQKNVLIHQSNWRVSQIRDKMNEDQKMLMQNKLQQYQQKIDKCRQDNNEQVKRLVQQIQRKQQKISLLTLQNNSMSQSLQSIQLSLQKCKSRISAIQKDLSMSQQKNIELSNSNTVLNRQIQNLTQQINASRNNIEQLEVGKDKKQQYLKSEMDKYMQKYLQSENGRNKIVFQLQTKLKDELTKKDQYYHQIIVKLQTKLNSALSNLKQTCSKKDKQINELEQRISRADKQIKKLNMVIQQKQKQIQHMSQSTTALQLQITSLTSTLKNLQHESEISSFSSNSMRSEIAKYKGEHKNSIRQIQQMKYELEIGNKTIQQQQSIILKLNRQIKMHQQREYYMEERYHQNMQAKTSNQEQLIGATTHYRQRLRKMQIKLKFTQEKLQESQISGQALQKQKSKLQQQIKNMNKIIFEHSHQLLKLQQETKRNLHHITQLNEQINSKRVALDHLESNYKQQVLQYKNECSSYIFTTSEQDKKIKQLQFRLLQQNSQWEERYEVDQIQKNNVLTELQMQMQTKNKKQQMWKKSIQQKDNKISQIQSFIQNQKQKYRKTQKQLTKTKLDNSQISNQNQGLRKIQSNLQTQLSQVRNELASLSSQNNKNLKRILKQKQVYTQIIKWIMDRSWDTNLHTSANGNISRINQYIQGASNQIETQLILAINAGLQRFYSSWDKNKKIIDKIRDENQKLTAELQKVKLQRQYDKQYNNDQLQHPKTEISESFNLQRQWHLRTQTNKNKYQIITGVDLHKQLQQHKLQQLRNVNYRLQKEIASKNNQIQSLNQEIFEQKAKVRDLSEQIKSSRQDNQDLNIAISKKSSIINSLQAQISQRDIDFSSYSSNILNKSNNKSPTGKQSNFREEAEAKYKQQKIISQLEKKLEELDKQNNLQKSKNHLLQNKLKSSSDKTAADAQKILNMQKSLKQKQDQLRIIKKQLEESESSLQKIKKQYQLCMSKIDKKSMTIEDLQSENEQQRQSNELLNKKIGQMLIKFDNTQKQGKKDLSEKNRLLLQTTQSLASQKMQKQKIRMELSSQLDNLRLTYKQTQRRLQLVQGLLSRSKNQNENLHEKYLKLMNELNQSSETIKDIKQDELLTRQKLQKTIQQLQQALQNKQFEYEQYKFSAQSKMMALQKQLQDRLIIQI